MTEDNFPNVQKCMLGVPAFFVPGTFLVGHPQAVVLVRRNTVLEWPQPGSAVAIVGVVGSAISCVWWPGAFRGPVRCVR